MKILLVEVLYPDSVGIAEIKDYCKAALEDWGGQRSPDDHLFYTVKAPKIRMTVVKSNEKGCHTGGPAKPEKG